MDGVSEVCERKLASARYAFHKVVMNRYKEFMARGMSKEEAETHYKKAMVNYDGIIEGAIEGASVEANREDMDKGFV